MSDVAPGGQSRDVQRIPVDQSTYVFHPQPVLAQDLAGETDLAGAGVEPSATSDKQAAQIPTNFAGVTLTTTGLYRRTAAQRGIPDHASSSGQPSAPGQDVPEASRPDPLFGSGGQGGSLDRDWAYGVYNVTSGWDSSSSELYLFNVLVAMAWKPSNRYFRQLQAAFRQASDLLYDVTNGLMAFGQVTFADATAMDIADIQITASNQTLPRSWVGGLLYDDKYSPIRIGRGAWVRNRFEVIPWDEADGYHAIIHEWAHYALEKRDEYLAASKQFRTRARQFALVVPTVGLGDPSIMATPQGRSELDKLTDFKPKFYPITIQPKASDEGPWHLPLPLPRFRVEGELRGLEDSILEPIFLTPRAIRNSGSGSGYVDEELEVAFPADFQPELSDRWAVYVLGADTSGAGQRIVAQGLLDARAVSRKRFTLFGVANKGDDTVLLIGKPQGNVSVRRWPAQERPRGTVVTGFPSLPFVDVIPLPLQGDPRTGEVVVRTDLLDGWTPTLFPGGKESGHPSKLDGQVLVRRAEDALICDYSRGGSTCSCYPVPTNPLSAGAADGGALIFGHGPDSRHVDDRFKGLFEGIAVVTTSIPWLPVDAPDGSRAISNVFSVASNASIAGRDEQLLQDGLNPTLTIFYDPSALQEGEVLRIYRQVGDEDAWTAIPTFVPTGSLYAAAPLDEGTAPDLIVEDEAAIRRAPVRTSDGAERRVRVERFCLFAFRSTNVEAV